MKKQYVILNYEKCIGTKEDVAELKKCIKEYVQTFWGKEFVVGASTFRHLLDELFVIFGYTKEIKEMTMFIKRRHEELLVDKEPLRFKVYPTIFFGKG